jgi:hypothetical protein
MEETVGFTLMTVGVGSFSGSLRLVNTNVGDPQVIR